MDAPQEVALPARDGLTIYADLSLPAGTGPFPLVVVARGAAGGSRDESGAPRFLAEHDALVPAGFAVATVCHRGTPGHGDDFASMHDLGGPHVDDLLAASEHLAARPEIDAGAVSVLGASRGAFMGALAIAHSGLFRRAVLINGYYDLGAWCRYQQAQFGDESPLVQVIRDSWPAFWATFPVEARSPDRYAGDVQCPVLLIHGEDDEHVPPSQSADFQALLQRQGTFAELMTVPALAHDYPEDDPPRWAPVWDRVIAFLSGGR